MISPNHILQDKKRQYKKGIAVLLYILLLAALSAVVWSFLIFPKPAKEATKQVEDKQQATITESKAETFKDDQFYPMTIPYLRSREYESEIYNIERFADKSNYIAYTATYDSDGYKVNGYLTIPTTPAPDSGYPAIVFIHGYIPPTIYKTTQNYVNYVDYFARNGFIVFKPDLRGHDNSEGEPFGAYNSGDYVVDTLNAYAALQTHDDVNPNAIGLWGHSMGGNVTFRSFVANKNIPALVIWGGAVYTYEDMQEFGIDDNSYRPPADNSKRDKYRAELRDAHGSFSAEDLFWQTVVPTNYLEDVKGNIQINHAVDDTVVSIEYSRNLRDLLSKGISEDINFELIEYNSGGHNIVSPSYEAAMKNSLDFFKKYLR